MTYELAIPQVTQTTCYSCGPASMLAVFKYLGVAGRSTERSLMREMDTTAKDGTYLDPMVRAASKRWASVEFVEGLDYDALRQLIAGGSVCILLLQAWADGGPPPDGYRDRVDQGHYVVAVAAGPRSAYFMDPSLPRVRARLTRRELEARWHELDVGRVIQGGAIVLPGPEPRWRPLGKTKVMG